MNSTTELNNEVWKVQKENEWLLTLIEPHQWYRADVKWDGCVHFYRSYNGAQLDAIGSLEDIDYLHICDIDDMIMRLQELKKIATLHFNNDEWGAK
jgi:hypothetical protein